MSRRRSRSYIHYTMAEEKNQSINCRSNYNSGGRGRGGRGGRSRGPRSQSFSSGPSNNQNSRQGRSASGRGNGNDGRQPRQPVNKPSNKKNQRQRPRSYSHQSTDYKKTIEGPYAHLFCSERHGFALSRVLFPREELSLSCCHSEQVKITSSQLEKWWECVKIVRCHVHYDESALNASTSLDRCPICLDDQMTTPHVAPCGHTFCLPCVLGYLNSVAKELNQESERLCKTKQKCESKSVVGNASKASVAVTTVRARCPMCSSGNSAELNVGDAMITYKDLRPIVCVPVSVVRAKPVVGGKKQHDENVTAGTRMKFVKLHRAMDCLAPYLPVDGHKVRGGCVRKSSSSGLDSSLVPAEQSLPDFPDGDDDAEECVYSRQYFVGCDEYYGVLQRSLSELIAYRDNNIHCQLDSREKWNVSMAIEATQASMRRWVGGNDGDDGFRSLEFEAKAASLREAILIEPDWADLDNTVGDGKHIQLCDTKSELVPSGSAYLNADECLYYQSCDGQLCFISGINTACLLEEFSLHHNKELIDEFDVFRKALPLPDSVEGIVIGVESMTVTPELVKRKHFLSFLPLGSSVRCVEYVVHPMMIGTFSSYPFIFVTLIQVVFVEIDWYSGGITGHKPMLTKATLNKFRADIQRLKSDRQRFYQIEEQNNKAARIKSEKEEFRRRKESIGSAYDDGVSQQTIDPEDDFFKPSSSLDELDSSSIQSNPTSTFKFNQVCAEGGAFPELVGSGSRATPKSPSPSLPSWGSRSGSKHLIKQIPKKTNTKKEAFPSLDEVSQTTRRGVDQMSGGKTCWSK